MRALGIAFAFALLTLPTAAEAYIGPGLGLGAVGMVLATIFSAVLAIVGLIWYPFKRLIRKFKTSGKSADAKKAKAAGSRKGDE